MSIGIGINLSIGVRLGGAGGTVNELRLTVTTTAPNETVTLQRITPVGIDVGIDWGDGSSGTIAADNTGTTTHQYASAGEYSVVVERADVLSYLDLRDSKISWTVGPNAPMPQGMTYLHIQNISNLTWTVSGDMPSGLTYLHIQNISNLTWTVSGDMPSGLTYLYLNNLSNLTWTVSGDMPSGLNDLFLAILPGLTWTVSGDMPSGLTSLNLLSLPGLTWTVSGDMPSGLIDLRVNTVAGFAWTVSDDMPVNMQFLRLVGVSGLTHITDFTTINAIRVIQYENSLTQPQVDAVVQSIWSNKANYTWSAPTLDILGTGNAAPSGTYQAASPPTTGKEYIYDLVNGAYTSDGPEWTVQYQT